MYFPRRYRHKLLLPPGLLALAFLLLLGCMQIARHSKLHPYAVIPFSMPPLHPDKLWTEQFGSSFLYFSEEQVNQFRKWDDLVLTGNRPQDSLALSIVYELVTNYQQDTAHARGLRIQFSEKVSYRSLIKLLDIMNVSDTKKYWLNLHHDPIVFYAFTDKRSPHIDARVLFICGGGIRIPDLLHHLPFWQWLDKWANSLRAPATWQPLTDPTWRNSLYLLLLLSIISIWKMARPSFY